MRFLQNFGRFLYLEVSIFFRQPPGSVGVSISCFCKTLVHVENFAPFTRVFRSTKTTLRQSVESIVFNHLAHVYSLVTAVVQELLSKTWRRTLDFILAYIRYYTLNVRSRGQQLVLFSQESWCFPRRSVYCYIPRLSLQQQQKKNRSEPKQSTRYLKWHKFNSQKHWMNDLQSTFLILSVSFSSTSRCFSSGNFWDNYQAQNRCFLAWGFVFVLFCSFTEKKLTGPGGVFPAFCHSTFHERSTLLNVSRSGYIWF